MILHKIVDTLMGSPSTASILRDQKITLSQALSGRSYLHTLVQIASGWSTESGSKHCRTMNLNFDDRLLIKTDQGLRTIYTLVPDLGILRHSSLCPSFTCAIDTCCFDRFNRSQVDKIQLFISFMTFSVNVTKNVIQTENVITEIQSCILCSDPL